MIRRDWTLAIEKVRGEGKCRVLGDKATSKLEAAHVAGRTYDLWTPGFDPERRPKESVLTVEPTRIVPLSQEIHREFDAHKLDLLPFLTVAEQAQCVIDMGGIEPARRRLAPSEYRRT